MIELLEQQAKEALARSKQALSELDSAQKALQDKQERYDEMVRDRVYMHG